MCGIALIVSGIEIDSSHFTEGRRCAPLESSQPVSLVKGDDLKAALRRRGPDSLGANVVCLHTNISNDKREDFSVVKSFLHGEGTECEGGIHGELLFIGATLQLRGLSPVAQPLTDALQNVLVYNGEIFGGIYVSSHSNDTEILMENLGRCCSCFSHEGTGSSCASLGGQESVPELLSRARGPWALIYWQDSSNTLWFGRDAFGRRSLLVHWPTSHDSRFLLSSVSPTSIQQSHDLADESGKFGVNFWEELPCGIYSVSIYPHKDHGYLIGEVKKHDWTDSELRKLMTWERTAIEPNPASLNSMPVEVSQKVLMALKESVMRRSSSNRIFQVLNERAVAVPVGVLFSGGLDSMIISALLHECMSSEYEIDLLNVSFDGEMAPDRISAREGLKELQRIGPSRRWNLVEIDADLNNIPTETKHVMTLISPAKTYMDLNIGIALWLAAEGNGWLHDSSYAGNKRIRYKSMSRILLVGSGADEQCAGYGRHRTKFRNASWQGLHEEMKLDIQRIWKRNLGRDDRCIADNAKEARFPFLDEDVIRTLLDIPLWEIANLNLPSGTGDKMILREVARLLGLQSAAELPKRAIQFGSRIARESNKVNFGSNRAANQASAGSVTFHTPTM